VVRLNPHITDEEWEQKYGYLANGVTETEGPLPDESIDE
jgi:hypothetical protein